MFVERTWDYAIFSAPRIITPAERSYLTKRTLIAGLVTFILVLVVMGIALGEKKPDDDILVVPILYALIAAAIAWCAPIRKTKSDARLQTSSPENVTKLNGWQRLWVVIATLYLPVVGIIAQDDFPQQVSIDASRVRDSISAVSSYRAKTEKGFQFEEPYLILIRDYPYLSNDEIVRDLHKKWSGKVNFAEIEADYNQKLDSLPTEQAKRVGLAFFVWLIPVMAVYAVGLVVAWVIKGFRRENP